MQTAKLFQVDECQAVVLPEEFSFEDDEVYIGRMGKAVILLPKEDLWDTLIRSLNMFSDDFMDDRQQPGQHDRR
ncbi:MAG TPA: type II toxin-antitoxin system VapB family antitoxin [Spirochaetia bacterium]|nr:type II toxin-antitoxin system VapB family antitoxin [Spirochaetia bacterium]